jgi:2,3-bisphosphoglycerate-dependent phosphoglycerate mutase
MRADPPLSKEGEKRAGSIIELLRHYTPDAIYSTNYTRTKATVGPLAQKFNKEIQVYDPRNQNPLSEQLLQMKGKTVVVVGHSNTTPGLVNLLIKENKYANLDDSVYNTYWIVTITDGKAEARELKY